MPDVPVPPKKRVPVALIVALIFAVAIGLRIHDAWTAHRPVLAELTLKGRVFTVEVADTDKKKEKGLGERDALPPDRGMYFPFSSGQHWVFWMKGMRFPIDILWIRDGKIVDIDASVPVAQGEKLETYSPVEPADAVLELNAGMAQEIGLRAGDELLLKALP